MGQSQQDSDISQLKSELQTTREQRNAALDTVAYWHGQVSVAMGKAIEVQAQLAAANERISQLNVVNNNYAQEIEAQAKRLAGAMSVTRLECLPQNVTMLNGMPSNSGYVWSNCDKGFLGDRRTYPWHKLSINERRVMQSAALPVPSVPEKDRRINTGDTRAQNACRERRGVENAGGKSWNNEVMAAVHAQGSIPKFRPFNTPVESLDHA